MIIPDVLYDKQCSGLALLQLNSGCIYIINDDDLNKADILLLFFEAGEC